MLRSAEGASPSAMRHSHKKTSAGAEVFEFAAVAGKRRTRGYGFGISFSLPATALEAIVWKAVLSDEASVATKALLVLEAQ